MEKIIEHEREVYLVEELELRLIIEADAYKRNCDDLWEQYKFDPEYFNRFIQGPLLNEYMQTIYTRSKPLNNNEINKWLTISLSQFKTHTPQFRKETMKELFWKQYWYPNIEPKPYTTMGEFYEKYFGHVFKWYEKHFHLFQEATEQALQDFKKGYLGSFADFSIQTQQEPKNKLKTNLTVKEIAYLFRALYDEGIIEAKHKTDIFNFIAESFSSKQKEDVSANSIKNAFDVPDFNAIDFWQGKFTHLMQRAKKDKEK